MILLLLDLVAKILVYKDVSVSFGVQKIVAMLSDIIKLIKRLYILTVHYTLFKKIIIRSTTAAAIYRLILMSSK